MSNRGQSEEVNEPTADAATKTKSKHSRSRTTSWGQLALQEAARPDGVEALRVVVGDEADSDAPVMTKVSFPPGYRVETHAHTCDYTEVVLRGSQKVGRTWHYAGDIRVAMAGTYYGPLIAGPDGAEVLIVFSKGSYGPVGMKQRELLDRETEQL